MGMAGKMDIVVCIKQVVQICAPSGVDPATGCVVREGIVELVNPYDENAVCHAVALRDSVGGGTVTVVTVGPQRAEATLRWCIAIGADRAVHIRDDDGSGSDPSTVARYLAAVIGTGSPDLIMCGKKSIDHEMGQVGAYLAEYLCLPLVTAVAKLEWEEDAGKLLAQRALPRGDREVVRFPLPAVLTMEKGAQPYPSLAGRQKAARARIEVIHAGSIFPEEAPLPLLETVRIAPPRIRPRRVISPDASLSAAGRLKFVMSGGMGERKGGSVGGDPEQLAKAVLDFLVERGFVARRT